MKSLISSIRSIGLLTIALTLALAANFAYGQWSNPPANPPSNNVDAPINVGSSNQTKSGDITARRQKASNQTWSPLYCDGSGQNCVDIEDVRNLLDNGSTPPPPSQGAYTGTYTGGYTGSYTGSYTSSYTSSYTVTGCMDRRADNYNSSANTPGECRFTYNTPNWNNWARVSSARPVEYCQYRGHDSSSSDSWSNFGGTATRACWEATGSNNCAQCSDPYWTQNGCYALTSVTCVDY